MTACTAGQRFRRPKRPCRRYRRAWKPSEKRSRVLIVEDDPDQYDALAFALDAAGYRVEHARDGSEALAVLQRFQPELVVTHLVMPGMSGDATFDANRFGSRGAEHPRILVDFRAWTALRHAAKP